MKDQHLPALGPRFWGALCLASIFGANMGDFFAHNIGLGHVAGLPFLAVGFAVVMVIERFDRTAHEIYYWLAIILVRTAATNLGDFFAGDLRIARPLVMAILAVLLALVIALAWQTRWKSLGSEPKAAVLPADGPYWFGMLLAGTLGTVMGDYFSHNLQLGDAVGAIVLTAILAAMFVVGSRGLIWSLPFYWATIVMVRAAGTDVGDFFASRHMLGLPLSTLVTGLAFVALLLLWKDRRTQGSRFAAISAKQSATSD
jgi:uncharacterized membrane-anchored protein